MGLDYDSMVMLTCKALFATAKAIVDIGLICPGSHKLCLLAFFLFAVRTQQTPTPPLAYLPLGIGAYDCVAS